MLNSIEGIYREGKVELLEPAPPDAAGRVIVTFLPHKAIDLASLGINEQQAANLRHRLTPFAEDWDRPEMDAYDTI